MTQPMSDYPSHLIELFSQIGLKLRAAREANQMSVEDIAARTRINKNFIIQIEKGELQNLPGLIFVKGFIRNFIQTLDLHDEELESELRSLTMEDTDIEHQTISAPHVNVLDTLPPGNPWFKFSLYALLGVLILAAAYLMFIPSGDDETISPSAPASLPPGETGTTGQTPSTDAPDTTVPDTPAPGAEGGPASETTPPAAPQPPAAAPAPRPPISLKGRQKLEVTIRGLEPTWVRLSIDRAPPIEVMMNLAETVTWQANQEIRLTIGKSQGVAVYLNGEEVILPQEANRLIPEMVLNRLTLLKLEN